MQIALQPVWYKTYRSPSHVRGRPYAFLRQSSRGRPITPSEDSCTWALSMTDTSSPWGCPFFLLLLVSINPSSLKEIDRRRRGKINNRSKKAKRVKEPGHVPCSDRIMDATRIPSIFKLTHPLPVRCRPAVVIDVCCLRPMMRPETGKRAALFDGPLFERWLYM